MKENNAESIGFNYCIRHAIKSSASLFMTLKKELKIGSYRFLVGN